MKKISGWFLVLVLVVLGVSFANAADEATHVQVAAIDVKGENGTSLQTLAITPEGQVVGLVSVSRYGQATPEGAPKPVPEVRVFDADGKELNRWPLAFAGQSIGVGPDGTIYVAGEGQVAKFSVKGELLKQATVPHLAKALASKDKLRKQAEEQVKAQVESLESALKSLQEQAKQLRDKGEKNLSADEKQQLEALDVNVKAYEEYLKNRNQVSVDSMLETLTARLRIINSITATDKDVFIACGEMKGYGYAIWRMDRDFLNPEQVMGQLGGCCGQMDVQAQGEHLFVAENTRHRVGQYDHTGKLLTSFGKRDRESVGEKFGGCCNPMNCRVAATGDVYTAESEGIVKKFNAKGEFVALIGVAKLTGGCKNVAVAASPSGDHVYFCDQPGSKLIILAKKSGEAAKPPVAAAAAN